MRASLAPLRVQLPLAGCWFPRRPAIAVSLALAVALAAAGPLLAQRDASAQHATGIELTAETQLSLARLGELWRQWLLALDGEDARRRADLADQILATADALGLDRLPDLARAAAARAVEAAVQRSDVRAQIALETAERFDSGQPEVSFAAAEVARIGGRPFSALEPQLAGVLAQWASPAGRATGLANLLVLLLYLLLLVGAFFLALQLATKGGGLVRDLLRLTYHFLPVPAAVPLTVLLLCWPLLLPHGLFWVLLYWSVLVWGYGSASERVMLIVGWLVLGAAPFVLEQSRRLVHQYQLPQVQAIESLRAGQLPGSFFSDLGTLRSTMADSPAGRHLIADVHLLLGQWELARLYYQQVLAADGSRASVLLNLGAYHYHSGDYGAAAEFFKRAAIADRRNPAAELNLSKTYDKLYFFDEANAARTRARQIDDPLVAKWSRVTESDGIQVLHEGLLRTAEIRRQLAEEWKGGEGYSSRSYLRHGISLLLAMALVLLAFMLDLARRPFGYSELPIDLRESRGLVELVGRALVPGLAAAELGEGLKAYAQLLWVVGFALLPTSWVPLYRHDSAMGGGWGGVTWVVAALGLAGFVGLRLYRALRARAL